MAVTVAAATATAAAAAGSGLAPGWLRAGPDAARLIRPQKCYHVCYFLNKDTQVDHRHFQSLREGAAMRTTVRQLHGVAHDVFYITTQQA